mgnify:CR=1 FL=1|jgi:hypothetical protein
MNYETQLNEIITLLTQALEDAKNFDNGVDVAGKRMRQAAQDAKTSLQTLRLSVQAERNSRKS